MAGLYRRLKRRGICEKLIFHWSYTGYNKGEQDQKSGLYRIDQKFRRQEPNAICPGAAGRPLTVGKKLYIKTYGCQMNVYDSDRMADVLTPLGYAPSPSPEGADLVILNTCHIREKAAEKVYSELGRLRALKDQRSAEGGRMIVAVAGCVAQAQGEEILDRAASVDIVLGPQTYHRLPDMIAEVERADGARVLDTEFPAEDKFDFLPEETAAPGVSAFLTIQEGCDRFCTFCVVPYTRGAEQSRPVDAVVREAERLVAGGAREITLLGQNVNAYHGAGPGGGEWRLGRLIRRLAEIDRLDRIRYTTSHPRDMDDDLIAAHGEVPALMPFLHLAGPIGVRPDSGGDEPPSSGRRLPPDRERSSVGQSESRPVVGFHRRVPRRARRGLRGDLGAGHRGRVHSGLFVQIQSAAGNARRRYRRSGAGSRQG